MFGWCDVPAVEACLNAASALLLAAGFVFIRRRRIAAHRACMLGAFSASVLFFALYAAYHAHAGIHRYRGAGTMRAVYLSILGTHTVLAAVVAPLAVVTLVFALRRDFLRHPKIARWTLPVWLYVSITGVVIYFLLYH